jgi:hypothetical protein
MQKRQQELLRQRREEEKAKAADRAKVSASRTNKSKQASMNKPKSSAPTADLKIITPRTNLKETTLPQQKPAKAEPEVKKISPTLLQPKPLVYNVNMFSKGNLSPRSRKTHE